MAQNMATDSITWHVVQLYDINSSESFDYECQFITTGGSSILWQQKETGSILMIKSQSGTWADIGAVGQVTYQISWEGKKGILKFERNADGVFISLDLTQTDINRLQHRYKVEQVK